MPLDDVHRIEEPGFTTRTATHAEIHNILGMENERATYEGLLKLRPDERPFVLTRATYAGGQRYGFTWTGDNSSTWNQLRLGTQMLLNLGLSGISFVGDDVGGFGGSPPPDLLTRWIEVGAFKPLYRDHTTIGSLPQEVWVHGPEQEAIRRRYIETRYRLLPYIYTLAEEASRTGLPLARPVFLEFPEIAHLPDFDHLDTEFLLGPDLLVAPPPFAKCSTTIPSRIPTGDWYDFWTGQKMPHSPTPGPRSSISPTPLPTRAPGPNSRCLPKSTLSSTPCPCMFEAAAFFRCNLWYKAPTKLLKALSNCASTLAQQCNGSLYLDDGHTFRYQHGEFLRQAFSCRPAGNSIIVDFGERQGTYTPWWKTIEVVIYDWPSAGSDAKLSSAAEPLKTTYDRTARALHIVIPDVAGKDELRIAEETAR